ncbi:MFS transporter [Streptacidiphilus anmyonensis]|uniref:MFS transporter n=1 Tax=Streptacidiphilus anmyonensis TaxID=405782 RepID=UPI001EED0B7E|nr:MFS transporter [Streptacidiphilus anmyonensis]
MTTAMSTATSTAVSTVTNTASGPAEARPGTSADVPSPDPAARAGSPGWRALLRAGGGTRYVVALAVDALGSGLLRPFLLLYGVEVLHLGVARAGLAMTVGFLVALAAVPFAGRWIDRGARSAAVAGAMTVRVLGVALLLAAGVPGVSPLAVFAAAALFLGVGNQCWPPAHAALVAAVAEERLRDGALAAGRAVRNAGLGAGALIATVATAGGPGALRLLAVLTALGYLLAGMLVASLRVRVLPVLPVLPGSEGRRAAAGRSARGGFTVFDLANLPYAFNFNVLEVALPAFLVTTLHAGAAWGAGIFVGNTVLVVLCQVAVVLWTARWGRRTAMAASGVVLAGSYLGFWLAGMAGGVWAALGVSAVSVVLTAGEIMYTGSATALVVATTEPDRLGAALARFQLSSGVGLAVSPAVLTALLALGSAALWLPLAAATLLAALAIHRWHPAGRSGEGN